MVEGRLAFADGLTRVVRHVVGTVLISWQRILRAALITAALAVVATEMLACLLTATFPPPPVAHLVAVALALALGYSVAVTMLAGMLLNGGARFIRQLEGEIEFGAESATILARSQTSKVAARLRQTLGELHEREARIPRPAASTRQPKPIAARVAVAADTPVAITAIGADVHKETMALDELTPHPLGARPDSRRDPDDAIIRAPAPAFQGLPVSAVRLPRIEWAYAEAHSEMHHSPGAASAPWQQPTQPFTSAEGVPTSDREPVAAERAEAPDAPDAPATSGRDHHAEWAAWVEATERASKTPDAPGLIPRGWYRNGSVTRPLPAITRPLPAVTRPLIAVESQRPVGGVRSGGLWQRVSQALVGHPGEPDDPGALDAKAEDLATSPMSMTDVAPEDAWLNG
jgi:hypothetical protein